MEQMKGVCDIHVFTCILIRSAISDEVQTNSDNIFHITSIFEAKGIPVNQCSVDRW